MCVLYTYLLNQYTSYATCGSYIWLLLIDDCDASNA